MKCLAEILKFIGGAIVTVLGIAAYLFISGAAIVVPVLFFLWVLSGCKH